jgi:N-acyl-D-amino-acid deacylase
MYDLLIINGEVLDGSGQASYAADIGIREGRIASIAARIETTRSRQVIDAAGLKVCPGFIDMHSHTDFTILTNPRAESKVRQGITTEVVGNCGFSAAPVRREHFQDLMDYLVNTVQLTEEGKKNWLWNRQSDYMAEVAHKGTAVNLASLVGHGTIRVAVMGFAQRLPSPAELSQMVRLLQEEMDRGIWGFSSGLQYDPGSFAAPEELVVLAAVVARRGGLYTTHMKSEGHQLLECLAQSLAVAEKSGVSLQVSHLKAENPSNWGKTAEALRLIDRARAGGINVDFDLYPYTAFGSGLIDLLPPWAREEGVGKMTELLKNETGRKKVLADMARPFVGDWQNPMENTPWDRVRIATVKSPQHKEFEGLNLAEAARRLNTSPAEAALELLLREEGAVKMIFFGMCEEDVIRIMRHPRTIFCTDGRATANYGPLSAGKVHPRYYGAYPRILGHYVREKGVLPLEEAVKKMTLLPALKLQVKERGLIKEGYHADITIFDAENVLDLATFEDPHRYPRGIEHVLVNGTVVVSHGEHSGKLPGRVLDHRVDSQALKNN